MSRHGDEDWMSDFYDFLVSQDLIRDKLAALAADLVVSGHGSAHIAIAMVAAELLADQIGRVDAAVYLEAKARNLRAIAAGGRPE